MATINLRPSLLDVANRLDPDGSIAQIVELLSQSNPIINDGVYLEGNLPTGHKTTVRSGLPTVTWRKLNYGVQPSKSTTVQVVDTAGELAAFAEVDRELARLNGNDAAWRLSEDAAYIEAMNQAFASTLFYGDTDVNPERFTGLAPRYSLLSADTGANIVDAGGTGTDNTSIWLVSWGPTTCHLFYPKGSRAGMVVEDQGEQTLTDAVGGKYIGLQTFYQMKVGLTLRDWREVVRIANVDVSDLNPAGTSAYSGPNLPLLMIEAINRLYSGNKGRMVFYCNRRVKSALDKIAQAKVNVNLTIENFAGKPTTMFWGIPIHRVDALLNTEARVV